MKFLIIGGTQFVGRHIVEAAQASGHEVTLFNRGRTNPNLFPDLEQIHGNRDGELELLGDRSWDAVIDTSGYVPRIVKQSADYLAERASQYVFISTVSVYDLKANNERINESGAVSALPEGASEEIVSDTYGALKALCENVVKERFPDNSLIVRPGIIVGPFDPSDRLTYWVNRSAKGGPMAAPEHRDQPVQIIDARDLAAWIITMVEQGSAGIFNAVGPALPITMERLLEECKFATGANAELIWVPVEQLIAGGAGEQVNVPLWIPNRADWSLFHIDALKAISAKLTLRPLSNTIQDIQAWVEQMDPPFQSKVGIDEELEMVLMAAAQSV